LLKTALRKIHEVHNGVHPFYEDIDNLKDIDWIRPNPPYHITSLFVNRKKENMEKEEFKKFKEGIQEKIPIRAVVVVEDYLIVAVWAPTSIPVENKVPHMTLLLSQGKAFESNQILEDILIKNHPKKGPSNKDLDYFRTFYYGILQIHPFRPIPWSELQSWKG
jgi:hypothetical protein